MHLPDVPTKKSAVNLATRYRKVAMAEDKVFWKAIRQKKKLCNKLRKKALLKKLPMLRAVCARTGIEMTKTDHGYQFSLLEYVINWSPSTNKVSVQYRLPGASNTVTFARDGEFGKPRILIALEELYHVTRRERLAARSQHTVYPPLPAEHSDA